MRWLILGGMGLHLVVPPIWIGFLLLFLTDFYTATTSSMEPTIHCSRHSGEDERCLGDTGDEMVLSGLPYLFDEPKRGEIVSFDPPDAARAVCEDYGPFDVFVKRVVALEGDRVEVRKGVVYVNAIRVPEPYVNPERDSETYPRRRVPAGHLFVMGDDRAYSCDSRHFGPVPLDSVEGKLVATW